MKIKQTRKKDGQGMVEYLIIVVVIALAAIAIFGVVGDTVRGKMGGAVTELGGDSGDVDEALSEKGADDLKNMDSPSN